MLLDIASLSRELHAGVDLVDYSLARTIIITAVSAGLQRANATFTLPQIQKHSQDGADQATIEHVLASMDQVRPTLHLSMKQRAFAASLLHLRGRCTS